MSGRTCQYTHEHDHPCTLTATHILYSCRGKKKLICAAALERVEANMQQTCIPCRRKKSLHWDLYPIIVKGAA